MNPTDPANGQSNVEGVEPQEAPSAVAVIMQPNRRPFSRLLIWCIVAVLVIVGVVIVMSSGQSGDSDGAFAAVAVKPGIVDITSNGFVPATIVISPGQSVEWINEIAQPHQPATDPYPAEDGLGGFRATSPLQKGQTYSFVFQNKGTYTYHDHLNPNEFKGTVTVK